jgi:hypothetical protein
MYAFLNNPFILIFVNVSEYRNVVVVALFVCFWFVHLILLILFPPPAITPLFQLGTRHDCSQGWGGN